jgi:putative ABC transport system ATP-binding protein
MSTTQTTATGAVVLRTEHLGRRVGDVSIVNDISLEVHHGEMLGIVGASGSGKSSFLRLLNRLDEPTAGTVFLNDQDYRQFSPRELRRRVGLVTQRPFLFPGNVAGNVRFGPLQRSEVLADEDIARLLERVGLPGFAGREVTNLSGGEQQRVSLARALANHPEILLLDEPTSALDEQAKTGVEQLICSLVKETSLTCVMVTHDRDQARRMCDRVALLEAGRLIQYGKPAEVLGA